MKKTSPVVTARTTHDSKLLISFVAMVFIGLGNKIFQKLQTIPMRNYPTFLNLLTTFIYIPVSFAYIFPMIKYGSAITVDQRSIPKRKFAVMGALDSVAGILQVFAATYLGGSLIILLGQAAIPVSMVISSLLLKTRYSLYQYVGAVVVTIGLVIVLGPGFGTSSGNNTNGFIFWSLVMIFSCVPMCLSSVYKEKALGETELDAVYLNGWIAVFQFICSIPLTIPAAMVGDPPVKPNHLLQSLHDGFKCYLGQNTITDGPHKDDCDKSTVYVTAYLLFNVAYNLLIILILKFGSANILWLAMTIMVPLGNVAFTFPFMPEHQPLHTNDIIGLLFIMLGLFVYRFLEDTMVSWKKREMAYPDEPSSSNSDLKRALIGSEDDTDEDAEWSLVLLLLFKYPFLLPSTSHFVAHTFALHKCTADQQEEEVVMLATAVKRWTGAVSRASLVPSATLQGFFSTAAPVSEPPVAASPKKMKLKIPTKRAASLLQQLNKEAVEKSIQGKDIDAFKPGDAVEVQYLLSRTGGKVQRVKGVVLARRNRGTGSSFVIRNHIGGYGYEQKIFLHSPLLQSVKVLQEAFIHKGKKRVRRAKLFYLREKAPSFTTV